MTTDQAQKDLEPLAQKLGTTVEHIWDVLKRQAVIDGLSSLCTVLICGAVAHGEEHPSAKLSNRQVRAIRSTFKFSSSQSLAEMFNVSKTTIWNIRNGKWYQSV